MSSRLNSPHSLLQRRLGQLDPPSLHLESVLLALHHRVVVYLLVLLAYFVVPETNILLEGLHDLLGRVGAGVAHYFRGQSEKFALEYNRNAGVIDNNEELVGGHACHFNQLLLPSLHPHRNKVLVELLLQRGDVRGLEGGSHHIGGMRGRDELLRLTHAHRFATSLSPLPPLSLLRFQIFHTISILIPNSIAPCLNTGHSKLASPASLFPPHPPLPPLPISLSLPSLKLYWSFLFLGKSELG